MSTEFLTEHARVLAEFAEETQSMAEQDPSNFWLRMAAENQEQAAHDAMQELRLAYAEEVGELLDLRFIGPQANGSISLDAFIRIADSLFKGWKAAAYRIRHGTASGVIKNDIADRLNLKLAGLGPGSTRILITGNCAPDLAGESLLHSTLVQTFCLLNAKNDVFYDAVDAIGGRAAQHFADAMRAIDLAGLAAEFSWNAPAERITWFGTSQEVTRLRTLLAAVADTETFDEEISGTVSAIYDTGRLELRTMEGKVHVRFPLDLTGTVQKLSIKKATTLRVTTTRYLNQATKQHILRRLMIDVVPDL